MTEAWKLVADVRSRYDDGATSRIGRRKRLISVVARSQSDSSTITWQHKSKTPGYRLLTCSS